MRAGKLAGNTGERRDRVDGVDALALLRHAHAPAENRSLGGGVHARCLADSICLDAADLSGVLGGVALDNLEPLIEPLGMGIDELFVMKTFFDDDICHRVEERKV